MTRLSCTDSADMAMVVASCTGNTDVLAEETLDVPGATVEIVETDHPPLNIRKLPQKGAPQYRQRLLLT